MQPLKPLTTLSEENLCDISLANPNLVRNVSNSQLRRKLSSYNSAFSTSNQSLKLTRRPSDHFFNKLHSTANTAINDDINTRPISGDSILSLQSNGSSEFSNFDSNNNSRLSSLTSTSNVSPLNSPVLEIKDYKIRKNLDKDELSLNKQQQIPNNQQQSQSADMSIISNTSTSSTSTLIATRPESPYSSSPVLAKSSSKSSLNNSVPNSSANLLKARSTNNVLHKSKRLSRSNSLYSSKKKIKERDEMFDNDDDELPDDDIILAFNVPLANTKDFYFNHGAIPSRSKSLKRSTSVKDRRPSKEIEYGNGSKLKSILQTDDAYSKFNNLSVKPSPLPGKLAQMDSANEQSEVPVASSSSSAKPPTKRVVSGQDISTLSPIAQNISEFYSERSQTISQNEFQERRGLVEAKVPYYLKNQSLEYGLEDIRFISNEKLNVINQTRPAYLPPKNNKECNKHDKDFSNILNNFSNKQMLRSQKLELKMKNMEQHNKNWNKINEKDQLTTKLLNKYAFKDLSWSSTIPEEISFDLLVKILNYHNRHKPEVQLESYNQLNSKLEEVKVNKETEFSKLIAKVLDSPLFSKIIGDSEIKLDQLKEKFSKILNLKSLSIEGIHKHDETMIIPSLLLLYPNEPIESVFNLIQLIDYTILDEAFLNKLNNRLNGWSRSTSILRWFKDFPEDELENLSLTKFIQIIINLSCSSRKGSVLSFSSSTTTLDSVSSSISSASGSASSNNLAFIRKLIQTMVVFGADTKVYESLLINIIRNYHFGWNSVNELISADSINVNIVDTDAFVGKWKDIIKRM